MGRCSDTSLAPVIRWVRILPGWPVRPELQGRGVGRLLVADLIQQAERHGMYRLTVNTQSDNSASLALYRKIGFMKPGNVIRFTSCRFHDMESE